jgi:hypothetical protein
MESDEITEDDKAAMLWRNAETFYKLPSCNGSEYYLNY